MRRKVSGVRPSPNEEARLVREERERRRRLRIQQVREQQRDIALHIRQEVERRRQRELQRLGQELREDWECRQREKLNALQNLYQESLRLVGQGHRSAKENEPDLAAMARKEEEDHLKAEERYREALKELKSQRLKEHERRCRSVDARKLALQTEKERAAKVANLPPPRPSSVQPVIESKKPHVLKRFGTSAFASTRYPVPEGIVDREAGAEQPSAHEGAGLEERRLDDLQREEKRKREEQLEKARLRGTLALKREHLEQDRERFLVELEHMQQTDLLRRRRRVSQMPPQISQPLCKRREASEEFQRELQFAFEDMCTGERRVKGDLVVQLVPEPLPALSTASQDQELDVTLDEGSTGVKENTQPRIGQEASAPVNSSEAAPRRALKKLLQRVRSQRNDWAERDGHVSGADSPTATPDQIPERDSTIDTGSLTSGDKDGGAAAAPLEPSHPTPPETTEQSTAADVLLPVSTRRIQRCTEEGTKGVFAASRSDGGQDCLKPREEERQKEMQQQLALLQELEEQRARLEEILLEAQHEREALKAAVTQEVPVDQPGEPVGEQEVTELATPPGEGDPSRKILEYQERLLEQNRIHRRSVEVARQRLEEYQRALQSRYSGSGGPGGALPCNPDKRRPPLEVPTGGSGSSSPPPQPCRLREGSSMLRPLEESISGSPGARRSGDSAWLTDSIMERVTKHLPESVRPSPVPRDELFPLQPASGAGASPHGSVEGAERKRRELRQAREWVLGRREAAELQQGRREEERRRLEVEVEQIRRQKERLQALIQTDATMTQKHLPERGGAFSVTSQPTSDPSRAVRPTVAEITPAGPGWTSPPDPVWTGSLSSREASMAGCRRETHKGVLQQRTRETLHGPSPTGAQPASEASGEASVSETAQARLKLLASLLRAIEETNGGTLSHLEEPRKEVGSPRRTPFNEAAQGNGHTD
ncbi:centrosomal protein of 295 kDa-like [Brachionichthys hirsutus]|uniref:centrosomal protein of 295 kDa-like n=1 Tax=Brachionichthys hirsutus TaxID=412623 RepID=UPI00360446A6